MFKNYLKSTLRFITRNKLFTIINVSGLALGLAAGIYILMFVLNEFSFDRFNKNLRNIYRVDWIIKHGDSKENSAYMTAGVGPSLLEEFPEVESMSRFSNPSGTYVSLGDGSVYINQLSYVDSSFFSMFTYPLLRGDNKTIFREPFEIALSESLAHEIFPDTDPIGQVIKLDETQSYKVTGVFRDVPVNSHLQFDALASFSSLYRMKNVFLDWNGGVNYFTYVLLGKNTDPAKMKEKFPEFMEKHINYIYREKGWLISLDLEPLSKVHLFSKQDLDTETKGSLGQIYILSAIALLIILMACFNFINLSIARALKRSREIGMRKVMGATRGGLIRQFLIESVIYILISFVVALLLVDIFQPFFNDLIGKDFHFFDTSNLILFITLPVLLILISLFAGGYPAIYLSRFMPLKVLKGLQSSGNKRNMVRSGLVVFQFLITAILLIATLVVYRQIKYVNHTGTGYDKKGLMVLPLNSTTLRQNYSLLKKDLLDIPGIVSAGGSSDIPGFDLTRNGYIPEGTEESQLFNVLDIDPDYLGTMHIKLLEGRNFDLTRNSDSMAYIVNESFVRHMGWKDPLEKTISRNGKHRIIGVISDFNFASLHKKIAPLILTMVPWKGYSYLTLRLNTNDIKALVPKIESAWKRADPGVPFDYFMMDSRLKLAYNTELNFGKMFRYFGIIAVVIACLGLLGLSSFITEQRRKEVGIRKILGASSFRILKGFTMEFLKLVVIANLVAWPLAWYLMNGWLDRFAYRSSISVWIFIATLILSGLIALVTTSLQVISASFSNPVDVLKYE